MALLMDVNYTYQMSSLFQTVALFDVRLGCWSGLEYLSPPLVMANSLNRTLDCSPFSPFWLKYMIFFAGDSEDCHPGSNQNTSVKDR